jgi:catechol 2,3-dioxygenase-like lactoylglutathione lyase family enzyme
MSYQKTSYLEHTAIRVHDIHWHIRFFREALGMPVQRVQGDADDPRQVWTVGGVQIAADKSFAGPEGRLVHLGIRTEDLGAALEEVYKWGVTELPQGHNWFATPDGLQIELMQAEPLPR